MAYEIDALKRNKPGATTEVSDRGDNPAGLYRHPESGQELIAMSDPLFGNPQGDAAVRLGYEYIRPAEQSEIKTIVDPSDDSSLVGDKTSDKARLDQLELAQLRREKIEREKLDAEKLADETISNAESRRLRDSTDESALTAKQNAVSKVAGEEEAKGNDEGADKLRDELGDPKQLESTETANPGVTPVSSQAVGDEVEPTAPEDKKTNKKKTNKRKSK